MISMKRPPAQRNAKTELDGEAFESARVSRRILQIISFMN
jgi:hypothetical protein